MSQKSSVMQLPQFAPKTLTSGMRKFSAFQVRRRGSPTIRSRGRSGVLIG